MTKIKLCGLSRPCDIEWANALQPEYIGFVFAENSRRYIPPERAIELKSMLLPSIKAVGVFVNEDINTVWELLKKGVIDIAQLHGSEDDEYISALRAKCNAPIIKAFSIGSEKDVMSASASTADMILLDCGSGGSGKSFDWSLAKNVTRPYFLAGGLTVENVYEAVRTLKPYGVDVSSGIESGGFKDERKMNEFVNAVRQRLRC